MTNYGPEHSIPFRAISESTLTAWAVVALVLVLCALMIGGCA